VEGARQAAVTGTIGAAFDVGANKYISSVFTNNSYLGRNIWPNKSPVGYLPPKEVIKQAALQRGREAIGNTTGDISSGAISAFTLRRLRLLGEVQ
jgi:hypothetical protein